MEQKFKMQIQRLAKHAAAVLTAVTVGDGSIFTKQ